MKVSCIIPVYNESQRVLGVIQAIVGHELVDEVIVVNDGSKDNTKAVLEKVPGINFISYDQNRGKSHAVMTGFKVARNDLVMMIDSDLIGLNKDKITALIEPVIKNEADMSMSLRGNDLLIYKILRMDFFTGERVFNKKIIENLDDLDNIKGFVLESFLNNIVVKKKLRLKVVKWDNVITPMKSVKFGFWSGVKSDYGMVKQIIAYLTFFGAFKLFFDMLRLKV